MPLGSFRLNGLSKKAAGPLGWASWDGTKDGTYADMGLNTLVNFLPINSDRGVLVARTGFYNISKSGTTLTLGSSIATGLLNASNDDPSGGYAIVDSAGTTGYWFSINNANTLYKFGSMSSSGVGTYGTGTFSGISGFNDCFAAKVRSDGKILMFGTRFNGSVNVMCRYIWTVTGTTSLTISGTYTDLGTTITPANIHSIAIVDDNTAVCIEGASGSVKAYQLTTTVTQIGSTYTTAFSVRRQQNAAVLNRYDQQHLNHGYALAMVKNSSNQLVFLKATTSSFTNFTISNPYNDTTQPETGSIWSAVSLDSTYTMFKMSTGTWKGNGYSTNNLLINATTGAAVRAAGDGDWEEKGRNFHAPWGTGQIMTNNWTKLRVIKYT